MKYVHTSCQGDSREGIKATHVLSPVLSGSSYDSIISARRGFPADAIETCHKLDKKRKMPWQHDIPLLRWSLQHIIHLFHRPLPNRWWMMDACQCQSHPTRKPPNRAPVMREQWLDIYYTIPWPFDGIYLHLHFHLHLGLSKMKWKQGPDFLLPGCAALCFFFPLVGVLERVVPFVIVSYRIGEVE